MEGPPHNENIVESFESTENALMDSFKAAALKVTTLYKDSLVQNRKSYAAGYQQALQDLFEFISTQPENGYIPVGDVLQFARQRNNQLTSEMGGNHNRSTNTSNNTHTTPSTPDPTPLHQQHSKIIVNPFQIDPHTQFTFTHDVPSSALWDQATTTVNINECNKRRLPEVSFLGRTMNLDGWSEPPVKRGRSRREEQLQLQQQQQIQQQQQQIQQQQLQLQQLQQLQQQQQQQHNEHQQQPH